MKHKQTNFSKGKGETKAMSHRLVILSLIALSIFFFPIVSSEEFGYNYLTQEDILKNLNDVNITNPLAQQVMVYNQSSQKWYNAYLNDSAHHVNASDYWNVNLGSLGNVNSTHFQNILGTLTISTSWLTSFGNNLWCKLTGCTMQGDIDMDGNNITDLYILNFNTTLCTDVDILKEGDVCWNADDHTLNMVTGLGPTLQVNQETIGIGINRAGETLSDGTVVTASGYQGDRMTFVKADSSNVSLTNMVGVLTQECENNQECMINVFGFVRDIDTTNFTSGDKLYIDPENPGILTNIKPTLPNNPIWVATATVIHKNVGTIFVAPSIDPSDGFLINSIWASGNVTVEGQINATILLQNNTYHAFGGIQSSSQVIPCTQNVWSNITNATGNLWSGSEIYEINFTNDTLTMTHAGDYVGTLSISLSGSNGDDYFFRIWNINKQETAGFIIGATTTGANNFLNVAMPVYLEDDVGDSFVMQVMNNKNDNDPTIRNGIFEVHYLHN